MDLHRFYCVNDRKARGLHGCCRKYHLHLTPLISEDLVQNGESLAWQVCGADHYEGKKSLHFTDQICYKN